MQARWRAAGAATAAVAVLASGVGTAQAAPGDLDPTFGNEGRLQLGGDSIPLDLEVAGATVLSVSSVPSLEGSGSTKLQFRATTARGAPDPAWFGDGSRDFNINGAVIFSGQLAVDSEGRVLVAVAVNIGAQQHRVYRFLANGDLDTTFDGDGMAVLGVANVSTPEIGGLGVQPDGDLVVSAVERSETMTGGEYRPRLVRVTSTGSTAQAVTPVPTPFPSEEPPPMAVDAAGRAVVLQASGGKLTVRRYTDALALDPTFSGDGILDITRPGAVGDTTTWGGALDVAPDGSLLVSGTLGTGEAEQATLVARVLPTGQLDPSFSDDGIQVLSRPSGQISPASVGRATGGGAVVTADRYKPGPFDPEIPYGSGIVVWQVDAAGAPVPAFSGDGRVERNAFYEQAAASSDGTRVYTAEIDPTDGGGEWDLTALSLASPGAPRCRARPPTCG